MAAGRANPPPPVVALVTRKTIPAEGKVDPIPPQRGLGTFDLSMKSTMSLKKTTHPSEEIQYDTESQIENIEKTIQNLT